MWASSGEANIPNAEYLVPLGKVTLNVSEGRRDNVHGLASLSAAIEFNELLSIGVVFVVEGLDACVIGMAAFFRAPPDTTGCFALRDVAFGCPS